MADDGALPPAEITPAERERKILAYVAEECLKFEGLRQMLMNQGADDPVAFRGADRSVEGAVLALLDPARTSAAVNLARIALYEGLFYHREIGKLRFGLNEVIDRNDQDAMQAMQARDDIFARWAEFAEGMSRVGPAICKIRVKGTDKGTGFLVSDQHVLTAHHTVGSLIDTNGVAKPGSDLQMEFVFDDIVLAGKPIGAFRTIVHAAKDWLELSSVRDDDEDKPTGPLPQITPGRLDFALIKLAKPIGKIPPRYRRNSPRGSIDLANLATPAQSGTQMLIAHHPGGADLRLSVGLVHTFSNCRQRIRYKTPTVHGSSGAPCFSVDWRPQALHNAGYDAARVNQGIPVALIQAAITGAGGGRNVLAPKPAFLSPVTAENKPILGRQDLAERIEAMIDGSSDLTTITVTGATGSGKTFTGELVRSLAMSRGQQAFLFDAEKFAGDTPEKFARRLVNEISGHVDAEPPPAPDSRQRARWITLKLSEWTQGLLAVDSGGAPARRTLWLIFDGLDVVQFAQETHDLLVAMIAGDESGPAQPLRYVLLGYGGDLASVQPERIWRSDLNLLSGTAVAPFMAHVRDALGKPLDDQLREASAYVEQARDLGITSVSHLAKALERWAARRRKGADAAGEE
ncbi:trypsin-like peptidase domain-containing protein [Vineibacter terrae]|uniref:Trypsin-like peptidase domain-containing protein n=1 Tax=Vineibacter terrae TaxID=2586908 RepID=A0A5C8PSX0_9HYPH|nr:serine protease [Vineibacter terrae]TXL79471.1 trypsin-like peptidase domain-containing protein [Vineibacter terrae]